MLAAAPGSSGVAASAGKTPGTTPRKLRRDLSTEEARALLLRAISNQHRNEQAQWEYERREHRVARKSEKDDRIIEDKLFRVVPTGTGTLRLLVEENGHPVQADFYRKQLRDLEQALVWALDPKESKQKQRVEKWKKRDKERREAVDAVADAFLITLAERGERSGRALVKLELEPNPDYKGRSRTTEQFAHVRATLWIDEAAEQLARLEAEIYRDISVGGGILGKIYRGGRYTLEQREVAKGVWLPVGYQADFTGRKFVFGFQFHEVIKVRDYRRIGTPPEALAAVRRELASSSPAPSSN